MYCMGVCMCIITYRAPAIERQRRKGINSQYHSWRGRYNTDGGTRGVRERDGGVQATADSIIRGLRWSRPTARVRIVPIVLDKRRRRRWRVRIPFRPSIRIVRRLWVRRISHHSCRARGRCRLRWWAGIELMRCMRWDESRRGGTCAQRRRPRAVALSLR
jgi:hypothetical protein